MAVVVEVAKAGADGVAIRSQLFVAGGAIRLGHILELALAVVEPEEVGLQAVIGDKDVEMAILVEVGRRDAAPRLAAVLGFPNFDKGSVALIAVDGVRLVALVGLVAADVEVEEAVAVEVAPDGAEADLHGQRGKLDLLELLAAHVAPERAAFPAEQVEEAVVVEVAPNGRPADLGDLGETFALFVAPDLAADAEI